jgi:PhnB protein
MSTNKDHRVILPYIKLHGRCEEAIGFYREALGAELEMMLRFKESPDPMPPGMLPPGWESKVMHATLRLGPATLMLSDGCPTQPAGISGISLSLTLNTEAEACRAFDALAQGGKVTMPLAKTFWSPLFGMVDDQFGVTWMVSLPAAQPK